MTDNVPVVTDGPLVERSPEPARSKLIAAFASVYLIWGSTYLGIRLAIETIPPFLMLTARYMIAGIILYIWSRARGAAAPTARQWRAGTVIGALLILMGNGMVAYTEGKGLPSGFVSLLVAMTPIWMALIEWLRPRGIRPAPMATLGLVLGMGGVVLLIGPANLLGQGDINPVWAGMVMLGSFCWASGSIYSRSADLPASPLLGTAIEMLAGSVLLLILSISTGELSGFDPSAISTVSVLALLYLIVFGSLIGFTAYIWLLQVTTSSKASTYAYVNPVVAVLLGWGLAGEALTPRMMIAATVIVGAVALITYRKGSRSSATSTKESGDPTPVGEQP